MHEHETAPPVDKDRVTDPVCGMQVDADAPLQSDFRGADYRFCSQHCLDAFEADPKRYVHKSARQESDAEGACCSVSAPSAPVPAGPGGTTYTCPMHPEVRQRAPGWLPVSVSMHAVQWVQALLATPVVLWCGWPLLVRGWQSIRNRSPNMFTLIGLGVTVAWCYSCLALLRPNLFPPAMRMADGSVHVYFEAAAVITALVLLGQVLELRAGGSAGAAIRLLLGLAPNTAPGSYRR